MERKTAKCSEDFKDSKESLYYKKSSLRHDETFWSRKICIFLSPEEISRKLAQFLVGLIPSLVKLRSTSKLMYHH